MEKPKVSLIISAYNSEKYLAECLESVFNLNYSKKDFEVIVIDDCSKDKTLEVAKKFPCKAIRLDENKNVAGARNEGIKIAKGEIMVFLDADCVAEKNWLKELMENQDGKSIVGGVDTSAGEDTVLMKSIDFALTSFLGSGGVRRGKFRMAKYYPRGFTMCIPRKAFEEVGLFKRDMVPSEDAEFDFRAERAGYKLKFASKAIAFHKRRNTIKSFFRQVYNWGKSRVKLFKVSKKHLEPLYFIPALFLLAFISLIILSFFFSFFFKILLTIIIIYLFIILVSGIIAAIKKKEIILLFLVPVIIFLQHFAYGLGLLVGFFKKN